jgi:3-hydroxyisobutyrate dehydrogenase-like beta-hydroxyacid dehydrogenase
MAEKERIGIVGIGRMGQAMTRHLIRHGHENVSFLWALEDMQIVTKMVDQASLCMPAAGAIKELVKDARRIKQTNPPDWTGRTSR